MWMLIALVALVSTHSRLKAAGRKKLFGFLRVMVSTHSRLKAAGVAFAWQGATGLVSTHSRLKAAGLVCRIAKRCSICFNTQPPKGGWSTYIISSILYPVSTHSRLKAAGKSQLLPSLPILCFNTQPPKGGWKHLQAWRTFMFLFQHTAA